ncbi:MAG: general secretion pathway protein GspK [Nitrospirae bacterium]|nr:general secretion pathway protein GspK [Nitrospirota bacterium]
MTLITMLSIIAIEIVETAQSHYLLTTSLRDEVKARALAFSGVNLVGALLKEDLRKEETKTSDHLREDWNVPEPFNTVALGDGWVKGQVEDEERRFNVHTITRDQLACLARELEIEQDFDAESVHRRITEWTDRTGSDGVQEDPYSARRPPVLRPDAPFEAPGEVALIEGIGWQTYLKLRPYLTIWPQREPTQPTEGSSDQPEKRRPKINVNTAPPIVLKCVDKDMPTVAETILGLREEDPFRNVQDLQTRVQGIPAAALGLLTVQSDIFTVRSAGQVGPEGRASTVIVTAVLDRRKQDELRLIYWREE